MWYVAYWSLFFKGSLERFPTFFDLNVLFSEIHVYNFILRLQIPKVINKVILFVG